MMLCPQNLTSLVPWLAQIAIGDTWDPEGLGVADGAGTFLASLIISNNIWNENEAKHSLSVSLFFFGLAT